MKLIVLFIGGILAALVIAGGFLVVQNTFVAADPDLTPRNLRITRTSPTAAEITFETAKPAQASIQCSKDSLGPFELCGAETIDKSIHAIKTSIILEPNVPYYFVINISGEEYDSAGNPYVVSGEVERLGGDFDESLIGTCEGDPAFDKIYDINGDGCIRANDRAIYGKK